MRSLNTKGILPLVFIAYTHDETWHAVLFHHWIIVFPLFLQALAVSSGRASCKTRKTIVVFSAAGMYYLPIASRSYSLLPLLFMLLYMAYPKRYSHPLRYAVILFLLCQVHVLLCGLIGVLMLQWTAGAIRVYQQEKAKRAMLAAWLLMIGTVVFLFWQLSGCVNTNELVSVRAVTALSELRHPVLKAISMGSWFLTTIHLYDYGNYRLVARSRTPNSCFFCVVINMAVARAAQRVGSDHCFPVSVGNPYNDVQRAYATYAHISVGLPFVCLFSAK